MLFLGLSLKADNWYKAQNVCLTNGQLLMPELGATNELMALIEELDEFETSWINAKYLPVRSSEGMTQDNDF